MSDIAAVRKTVITLNNPKKSLLYDRFNVDTFKCAFYYIVGPAIVSYFPQPATIVIFSSEYYSPISAAEYAKAHFDADSYTIFTR